MNARRRNIYTTGEAAELLRVSQQTVIRMFDAGDFKGFRVPRSRFRRIPREALLAWAEATEGFGFAAEAIRADPLGDPDFRVKGVYTTTDVSGLFGWAPRTSCRLIDLGEIEGHRVPGSADRRVTHEALVAYTSCRPELAAFHALLTAPGDPGVAPDVAHAPSP